MHALTGEGYGPLLFRFAVIADTHVNPHDGRTSSPFATNALANERGSSAIADIDRHDPLLVVHVGDLVHPVPELPSFEPACERFARSHRPCARRSTSPPATTMSATRRSTGCPRAP